MKTIIIAITLILLFAVLATQRHALACEAVEFSNYEEVASNIFAPASIENVGQVLADISAGGQRVNSTFGKMISMPKIILVSNEEQARSFGANSTARAHLTPLGVCIVLGPKGQNVDVAAHELTHSEVSHRVGWFRHWREIPVWFNEGVALMVDHRKPFLVKNIKLTEDEIESVKNLDTGSKYFGGPDTHKNYLASRLAVNNIEPSTLYKKLELIRNGQSFADVFKL